MFIYLIIYLESKVPKIPIIITAFTEPVCLEHLRASK